MPRRVAHTSRTPGVVGSFIRTPLVFLCALSCGYSSHAQRLLLKDFSTQNGLPDSRIAPIIQDRKGYLWLGAQAGLTRYDGRDFSVISGSREVPGIFGRAIIEDHQQAIWYTSTGFSRGGLLRYRRDVLTDFSDALNGLTPVCIAEDRTGRIWIGSDGGLTRITFADSARNTYRTDRFPDYRARALLVDHAGSLWIACSTGTVYTYDGERFSVSASSIGGHVRAFAIAEREGVVWIGSTEGIYTIERGGKVRPYTSADGLPERGVWSFCQDRRGNFWIGTAKGLYRAHPDGKTFRFLKEPSFGDGIVYDMLCDAEGNVWFASHPGLRKLLASDLIVTIPGEEKLARAGFGPIAERQDGAMLFGSRNSGIFTFSNGVVRTGHEVRPSTDLTVLSIFPESATRTWFGLKLGGVIVQDGEDIKEFPEGPEGTRRSVHCFARLGDGRVLMGTADGLYRIDPDLSFHRVYHPAIDSSVVFDMTTSRGSLWIATQQGVWAGRIEGDRLLATRPSDEPLLCRGIVYAVLADTRGRLWFGTDGKGLVRLDSTGARAYRGVDGLAGDRVFALARDSLGQLWIGTASGLSQFDGVRFRNLVGDQGFAEIGLHGLATDRQGDLWVSSFPGVTRLRPKRLQASALPPPVYIDGMQVDSVRFSPGDRIEVEPHPAVITFRYAGLSYTDETNVRYRYILDGLDNDWSPPVLERQVRYTHLPPGRYTFLVVARTSDNVWSAEPASLSFVILPAFYQRWWFIAGILVAMVSVTVGLYRYRLAKALMLERTRGRIAMDLHDDIGSSLTRISVMSEVARRQNGTVRGETLARIGTTARELIDALDDIVWSVDPRHDELLDVLRRIVEFGQQVCEGRGILFETELPGSLDRAKLGLEQRRDLYLIFKEAITNAVRHSRASTVTFRVQRHAEAFHLELSDDGTGFTPPSAGPGHGLLSMKERGGRAKLRYSLETAPGSGTRLRLEVRTG